MPIAKILLQIVDNIGKSGTKIIVLLQCSIEFNWTKITVLLQYLIEFVKFTFICSRICQKYSYRYVNKKHKNLKVSYTYEPDKTLVITIVTGITASFEICIFLHLVIFFGLQ
jgi:hypothetical protein